MRVAAEKHFLGQQTERWKCGTSNFVDGCIEVTFGKGRSDFPERSCEFWDSHIEIARRNMIPNQRTGAFVCVGNAP